MTSRVFMLVVNDGVWQLFGGRDEDYVIVISVLVFGRCDVWHHHAPLLTIVSNGGGGGCSRLVTAAKQR